MHQPNAFSAWIAAVSASLGGKRPSRQGETNRAEHRLLVTFPKQRITWDPAKREWKTENRLKSAGWEGMTRSQLIFKVQRTASLIHIKWTEVQFGGDIEDN